MMNNKEQFTRRHRPVISSPARLVKSAGAFSSLSLIGRKNVKNDGFTAQPCLSASSLERKSMINTTDNPDAWYSCPKGYGAYGYLPGTKYQMICVKNDYDKDSWAAVSSCCSGGTAEKDCDPTLCPRGQGCRDKMSSFCTDSRYGFTSQCQKWANMEGNEDVKTKILTQQCTSFGLFGGPCRDFAKTSDSYGKIDSIVATFCASNPGDSLCTCINSSLNKIGEKSPPPSCFDSSCRNGGYQTGAMATIAKACPSWVDCRTSVLAAAGGVNTDVNVQQICGVPPPGTILQNTPAIKPTPTINPTPASPSTPSAGSSPSTSATSGTSGSTSAYTPPLLPSGNDDVDKLREDDAHGGNTAGTAPKNTGVYVAPSISAQFAAPFIPGALGDISLGLVTILFFVSILLFAVLYRVWQNRIDNASSLLAMQLQEREDVNYQAKASALSQEMAEDSKKSAEIKDSIRAQMQSLPKLA